MLSLAQNLAIQVKNLYQTCQIWSIQQVHGAFRTSWRFIAHQLQTVKWLWEAQIQLMANKTFLQMRQVVIIYEDQI